MTSKKTTRRALLSSVIALILCCSMLVGTTFAWFTDEVKSVNNVITAGNLDVDVVTADGNSIHEKATLFDEITLWEPGVVAYETLTVKNIGTLALSYRMTMSFDNATATPAGKTLADILQVGLLEGAVADGATRDEVLASVTAWEPMGGFTVDGELVAGTDAEPVTLVIYWEPGTDDNDYNMNNGETAVLSIDLGVHVFATQLEAESDSFGPDYDEDADRVINAGETVYINDETVEESYENFGDLTITDSTVTVPGRALTNHGEAALENVTMTFGSYGVLSDGPEANTTLDEVNITAAGGALAATNGAELTFNSGSATINSTSTSQRHVFYAEGEGSVITVNGGTFAFEAYRQRSYACAVNGATIYITGGDFGVAPNHSRWKHPIYTENGGKVIITGGTFKFDPTEWVAVGYEAVKNGDTWTVQAMNKEQANAALKDAIASGETEIAVGAGTYTFPASSLQEGQTLICAEGTVFEGSANMNINGATVVGATFSNPSGSAGTSTVNGTYKDCTFEGSNGLRWAYAGDTVVFENCVFSGSVYGIHFDGGANEVVFKNCTISGFNATAAAITKISFEGCTFVSNGLSAYNGINLWGNGDFTDCTFVFDGSASYEWIDLCSAGKTATFTNCVVDNGATVENIETVLGTYLTKRQDSGVIVIDGAERTY